MRAFIVVLALILSAVGQAAEFAVSPMLIELDGAANVRQPFQFNVFGKSTGNVKLSVQSLRQQPTGHMDFVPDASAANDMAAWVRLETDGFAVREGETRTISGELTVPRGAQGTYLAAVMVEEERPESDTGVTVNVRYAVILTLDVAGPRRRVVTTFDQLQLSEQDGRHFIEARFVNSSAEDHDLLSELQLRDSNNRLAARIPLRTQSAWQRGDDASRVFPGAEVVVYGEVPASLLAGDYVAMVRNQFGGRAQPTFRGDLNLPVGAFAAQAADDPALSGPIIVKASPVRLRADGQAMMTFTLKNQTDSVADIAFPQQADTSVANVESYQFLPDAISLAPGQQRTVMLRQRAATNVDKTEYAVGVALGGDQHELLLAAQLSEAP